MKMTLWKALTLVCAASIFVDAKWHNHQKRDISSNICDPVYNNTNKVQCYCMKDNREADVVRTADCYLIAEDIEPNDTAWDAFEGLKTVNKLTLTNTRGITLKYIPTKALNYTDALLKLDVKYGNIKKMKAFSIANLSSIEEITLRDNQIEVLETYALAHHTDLTTINLDKNNIVEINRDVFIDLPSLEKLFLTSNKITTIHDRAFIHLINLRELEIDRNNLFSLNSETFSGLKKLQKLDLSSNSLQVVGDNTFLPLNDLRSLNLEGNKIQMLDEKAFNGLTKLQSLSLSHNKLSDIDNVKIFEGLETLTSLSLRANQIRELKTEVMAPILNNFYNVTSNLDVEDNNFPCDCRLDWFISLMNKTQNNHLRLAIENLKCYPDTELREMWVKNDETQKNVGQVFEDEESQVQNTDYEYYDDTQLNGKLFYIDVRDLLNCTNTTRRVISQIKPMHDVTTPKSKPTTVKPTEATKILTKATSSLKPTTAKTTSRLTTEASVTEYKEITNQGVLDLSIADSTTKTSESTLVYKNKANDDVVNVISDEKKQNPYTTTRLATVSAKPIQNVYRDSDMASDEAKPDKLKAHRSIQDEIKDIPDFKMNNNSYKNVSSLILIAVISCARLFF